MKGTMITLDEAFRIMDETLAGVRMPGEAVPVRQACGRILAGDHASRVDLPPFDKSAMDGYAVMDGDERAEYRLLETVPAGGLPGRTLVPGTAAKVMTGAAVPAGAGRVIMVEYTDERDGIVRVGKHPAATNICRQGEDVRVGQPVLAAGSAVGPLDAANLVACGITDVEVVRRLRVAVISTGDEIVDSPDKLGPGKIMDVNRPLLEALCDRFGMEVVVGETVPDDMNATVSALRSACELADIVVFSGGVSVGDFDFVSGALGDAGLKLHFSRVAVKPGKPMTYASGSGRVVLALPGNPVSVYLMFHLFVLRAAARMMGIEPIMRERPVRLGCDFKRRKTQRREFVPALLNAEDAAEPVDYHGSAHLLGLTRADGFFIVPVGVASLRAGDKAGFLVLPRGWR